MKDDGISEALTCGGPVQRPSLIGHGLVRRTDRKLSLFAHERMVAREISDKRTYRKFFPLRGSVLPVPEAVHRATARPGGRGRATSRNPCALARLHPAKPPRNPMDNALAGSRLYHA